jgi:tetratricopeptide (TPR) repeat protein
VTALALQRESRQTLAELVAKDAADVEIRGSLAAASLALADTLAASGRQEEAIAEVRVALDLLGKIAAADPSNIDAQVELASAQVAAARTLQSGGDKDAAGPLFTAALERLDAVASDSSDPAVLHARTAALAGVGDADAARAVAERLLGTGYRQADFMALARSLGVSPAGS